MTQKQKYHKPKILIADASEKSRATLAKMLGEEYTVIEADNEIEVVALLREASGVDLLLLDMTMPEMGGFEVLAAMNRHRWIEDIPVIIISTENSLKYLERAYELGATDCIRHPFDAAVIRHRVANSLMLHSKRQNLRQLAASQNSQNEKNSNLMVNILSSIVDFRNGESRLHMLHVHTVTELLLRQLLQKTDQYPLSQTDISLISFASVLHDIGKVFIPDRILNKPGKLTPEEFEQIKTHAALGADMLRKLPLYQDEPLIKVAYEICRWHHERYDGSGYPDGLVGDKIPISAQIVSLADVYDALTSERVYKKALPHDVAIAMIQGGECGVFHPLLLECLKDISDDLQQELEASSLALKFQTKPGSVAIETPCRDELSSEHIFRLLEQERAKYQFFDSLTREVQFEYTAMPPMLRLSDWGATHLGLDKIIMDPMGHQRLREVVGAENLDCIAMLIQQTTLENPDIQHNFRIHIKGETRWCRMICRVLWSADGEPQDLDVIGKLVDINEEHTQMLRWQRRASYDGLTGLLNVTAAQERIQQRIQDYPNRRYVMLIADVDHFKTINDTRGHTFGDRVLQSIASNLRHCIRGEDIAARAGGDEFLVFLEYDRDAAAIVKRVFEGMSKEYEGYPVSMSLGAVTTDVAGRQYEALFHRADQALYAAKFNGRNNFCFYDDTMNNMLSSTDNGKEKIL